jgi:hypothetical protein
MAIASLVLGIVAIIFCWFPWIGIACGAIALILGIIHLVKSKKETEKKGKGMSIAGIITGAIGLVTSLIIIIVAATATKALINFGKDYTKKQNDITNSLKDSYSVGETADINGLKLTVVSFSDYVSDDEYCQPETGKKFVRVEIEAKNDGENNEYVSSFDFDCYANNASVSEGYTNAKDQLVGANLSDGKTVSGAIYYEIPEDATNIQLEYAYGISTNEKVVFNLQ